MAFTLEQDVVLPGNF